MQPGSESARELTIQGDGIVAELVVDVHRLRRSAGVPESLVHGIAVTGLGSGAHAGALESFVGGDDLKALARRPVGHLGVPRVEGELGQALSGIGDCYFDIGDELFGPGPAVGARRDRRERDVSDEGERVAE
jgi:hypothetical protein